MPLFNQTSASPPTHQIAQIPRFDPNASTGAGELEPFDSLREAIKDAADREPRTSRSGRYTIAGVLGRGGMGIVYRAMDLELRRPLAVKVLRHDVPHGGDAERRFLEEARVTGQLQHPGIPPVHEVGRLESGQPFFAMKLIEGRTLATMLVERGAEQAVAAPADLPQLLKVFEQVAQTLAYSHAQGVIHRDLKPANVMVGAFGEVQVMDWGLAKRLRGGPSDPNAADPRESSVRCMPPDAAIDEASSVAMSRDSTATISVAAISPDADRLTQAGQVMGTLAYMPPEQARGDIDSLDERSDVFGLGAILLAVLTGEPPYNARPGHTLYEQAATGDLADTWRRLESSTADAQLALLVRDCLAPLPQDRPRDAGAVAQRISGYLASMQERLKAAEIERAADQARVAEERKRRRVTIALAACAVLLVGGISFVVVRNFQNEALADARRAQTEHDVKTILVETAGELAAVNDQLLDPIAYRSLLDEPLRWQAQLDKVESGLKRAKDVLGAAPEAVDASLPARLADLESGLVTARQEREFVERLEQIRLRDAVRVQEKWTLASVMPDYQAAFLAAGFDIEHEDHSVLAARMRSASFRWPLVAALDHWAAVAREKDKATVERLLRLARQTDPHPFRDRFRDIDTWSSQTALAKLAADPQALHQSPQFIEALAWVYSNQYGDAKPLLRVAISRHPRDFWLLFRLGLIAPEPIEQAGYYRAALVVRPASSSAYNNLGNALLDDGLLEEGLACYQRALELDPANADVAYNFGRTLSQLKRYDEAVPWYHKAMRLDGDPAFVAMVHTGMGLDLRELDRLEEAVQSYELALSLNPKYALAHNNLGLVYKAQGKLDEARACYERAIAHEPKLAMAHANLGKLLHEQGKQQDAMACYRKALELDPKYADAHLSLGVALKDQNHLPGAVAAYREALEIAPRNALAHRNLGYALFLQRKLNEAEYHFRRATVLDARDEAAHHNLGSALKDQGKLEEAATSYRKSLELDPKYESAWLNLGNTYRLLGKLPEAIECFQELLELNPNSAEGYHNLGATIYLTPKADEAIAAYRKALELDPKYALAYYNLGVALHGQGNSDEAIAAYRKAIELDPLSADAHRNLGLLFKHSGRFAEALPLLARGQELGASQSDWKDPSGSALRDCERLLNADALLPAVLAGQSRPQDAAESLALADLCRQYKRCYAAATRFYREAFAADENIVKAPAAARYNAACTAALAAFGQGADAAQLDESGRASLRRDALAWMRAELENYRQVLESGSADQQQQIQMMLKHLPGDGDLACVRDAKSLAELPITEQESWRAFWKEVAELAKSVP